MAKDWSREVAAVASQIGGVTANIIGAEPQQVPGATHSIEANVIGMASIPEQSFDCIVSVAGIAELSDIVAGIRACRRGLKEGGKLVLVLAAAEQGPSAAGNTYSAQCMVNLLLLVGGFEVGTVDEVVAGESYIIVASRTVTSQVRAPFGVHGPEITKQVLASEAIRAEYYFQIGTMMLQTGDAGLAVPCFENVLRIEPGNAEAHFGLGMTYGTQARWNEALAQFQRSLQIDPQNGEVQRWVTLAQQQLNAAQNPTQGVSAQQINIPQVAPAPAGRSPSQVQSTGPQSVPAPAGAAGGGAGVQTTVGQPAGAQIPVSGT